MDRGPEERPLPYDDRSANSYPVAANHLDRDFAASAPNEILVSDITYIWTREGWTYLAVILDPFLRRVIGWSLDSRIDRRLASTPWRWL